MDPILVSHVYLRAIEQADLPRLYEFHLDPDSNRLAMTIPRSASDFEARLANFTADSNVVARAILVGELLVGSIVCFRHDGSNHVGYWLGKQFWGKGIASRALELLLEEIQSRPLYARVATSNRASLRVLQKCGFEVRNVYPSPADDRYFECEEALLVLT